MFWFCQVDVDHPYVLVVEIVVDVDLGHTPVGARSSGVHKRPSTQREGGPNGEADQ